MLVLIAKVVVPSEACPIMRTAVAAGHGRYRAEASLPAHLCFWQIQRKCRGAAEARCCHVVLVPGFSVETHDLGCMLAAYKPSIAPHGAAAMRQHVACMRHAACADFRLQPHRDECLPWAIDWLPPGVANCTTDNWYFSAAGIVNCGQTVAKEEGVKALWKGLTPFATHLTLKYALRFGTNALYSNLLRDKVGCQSMFASNLLLTT